MAKKVKNWAVSNQDACVFWGVVVGSVFAWSL